VQDLIDSRTHVHGLALRSRGQVGSHEGIHDRSGLQREGLQSRSQPAFGRFDPGCGVVRHESGQSVRPTMRLQIECAVESVEPGHNERRSVSDVVKPGRGHKQVSVGWVHRDGQFAGPGGDGPDVRPSVGKSFGVEQSGREVGCVSYKVGHVSTL
jgi:hypothetical protein